MLSRISTRFYCTNPKPKYSSTVLLPKTTFPLRLEKKKLLERDAKITNLVANDGLYKWQRSHLSEPEFVLHDGPPYANGSLHMGHAINKILKDTIVRYHVLEGHKVHFVPGWDCHGLPIELKALLDQSESDPLVIREKARKFAQHTMAEQMEGFKSWGVMADWNNSYTTFSPKYIKTQLKMFHKLYKKELVYRAEKPIYWSPSSQTALAEAELEYNDKHTSLSAYVRFEVQNFPKFHNDRVFALVWTTTPWTLPSNQAICYNPTLNYSLVKNGQDQNLYLVATELIPTISSTLNIPLDIIDTFSGEFLTNCTYIQPVFKKTLTFLPGGHVTLAKGTGLVHTAPAHGPDDFLLALQHKIQIENLVNEQGCYNNLAGQELAGKFVLEEGTNKVMELLGENIVFTHDYVHSYPYDWRTKKPVILRASKQWFIDTDSIKNRALELLETVEFSPNVNANVYKKYLSVQLEKRAYWCISRQRKWGVPIPVFFAKDDQPVINGDSVRHFCDLVDNHGGDFWWKLSQDQLFPKSLKEKLGSADMQQGQDIMDIWFDSGISWANVLEGEKVADLYLEGVDQFTGWFQSSLITSVALRDKVPFRKIYVHGFAVDEHGAKMSKSLGNVIRPEDVIRGSEGAKPYGIDALRWWVGCHANQDSVTQVSPHVLQSCCDEVQKIRSVLRFAMAALDLTQRPVDYDDLLIVDKYLLHLLHEFHSQVRTESGNYNFHRVGKYVINLLTNPVSALYFTAIKDRLYCDHAHSAARKGAQYILQQIFDVVTVAIGPIVPHLVEEMHLHLYEKPGFFMADHVTPDSCWENGDVAKLMTRVLDVKKELNRQVGAATVDLNVNIQFEQETFTLIEKLTSPRVFEEELEDLLQVALVRLDKGDFAVTFNKSTMAMCPRCRRFSAKEELCVRCQSVVESEYLDVTQQNKNV